MLLINLVLPDGLDKIVRSAFLFIEKVLFMFIAGKISRALLLVSLLLSVASCGFHLRGSALLPTADNVIYLTVPRGTFEQELKDTLARSGAQFSNDLASSDYHLDVTHASRRREIGTLDERGIVDSYRLILTVSYRVFDPQGAIVGRYQTLTENRHYVFDPAEIVETESEEIALLSGMEKDIALRITRRLSAIGNSSAQEQN